MRASSATHQAQNPAPLLTPEAFPIVTQASAGVGFDLIPDAGRVITQLEIGRAEQHVPHRQQHAEVVSTQTHALAIGRFMAYAYGVVAAVKARADPQALAHAAKPDTQIGVLKALAQLRQRHQRHKLRRLHALHHSQRQMTQWSDSRNHLLDDLLRDAILVTVAQCIGVAPGQFVAIVALTQLSENLHHANLRLWFGRVGERLWVSPRFHRLHHAIGIGHESTAPNTLGGCNFGVLLPWWDMLFHTANFELRYEPTGIRDQVEAGPDGRVRDYGRGFWAQQWRGLLRLAGRA